MKCTALQNCDTSSKAGGRADPKKPLVQRLPEIPGGLLLPRSFVSSQPLSARSVGSNLGGQPMPSCERPTISQTSHSQRLSSLQRELCPKRDCPIAPADRPALCSDYVIPHSKMLQSLRAVVSMRFRLVVVQGRRSETLHYHHSLRRHERRVRQRQQRGL